MIAPIGSQHIVDKHKDYFKYDDSNITTYGRKGDILFNTNLKRQSGNVQVMPDLHNKNMFNWVNNHLLDTMTPIDIFQAKPTGFAAPITDDFGTEHIFTPDEIGNLSFEQFNKYENQIMAQLRDGKINNQNDNDFSGYQNSIIGNSKIFSREDIGQMSSDEYSQNEAAIFAQLNSIGIPTNNELSIAGGTIYVEPYVRSDGTPVRGYYRSV